MSRGNDNRIESLKRHLRNCMAHNGWYRKSKKYFFEDRDGEGYVTARIILSEATLQFLFKLGL